jgi:hypothetical protein
MTVQEKIRKVLQLVTPEEWGEGKYWYQSAHLFARDTGETYGTDLIKTCGIIAALSAQKSWNENKRIARTFLQEGKSYHTGLQTGKAREILALRGDPVFFKAAIVEILKGPKTSAFFQNIYEPLNPEPVCLDRHMAGLFLGKENLSLKEYPRLAEEIRTAAKSEGMIACELQGVLWTFARRFAWKNVDWKVKYVVA